MSAEPLAVSTALRRLPGPARYLVVGGLSFAVDYETLTVVHAVLDTPLWVATAAGFWVSFVLNFALTRLWTFAESTGHPASQLFRYSVLVAVNFVATVVAVDRLHALGASILLAKAVTVGTLTITTFLAYKHWVFHNR